MTRGGRATWAAPAVYVVCVLALAVAVGALWVALSPPVHAIVVNAEDVRYAEGHAANLFGGLATFAFLAFALGAMVALGSWFGLRRMRGVPGLLLAVGSAIAASGLAIDIGTRIAAMTREPLDLASPGTYDLTVRLWFAGDHTPSWLLLICAPFTAVLVYLICVLLARSPELIPAQRDTGAHQARSHGWTQGGEFVGHPQSGVGEGVQTGWAPAGATGAADGSGGYHDAAPRQDP